MKEVEWEGLHNLLNQGTSEVYEVSSFWSDSLVAFHLQPCKEPSEQVINNTMKPVLVTTCVQRPLLHHLVVQGNLY